MAKQNSGKPQIDENFMKEIISQGIPAKRDNQPDATPKEDAPEVEKETRQAEAVQVTEQPQTEKPAPRKRKSRTGDYRETYFQKVELSDRQPLYVSRATHEKLMRIVTVIGGRKAVSYTHLTLPTILRV